MTRSAIDPSVFRFSTPEFERRTTSFAAPGPGGFRSGGVMHAIGFGRGRR